MHNRALHFITNRSAGFTSALFPASDFSPCVETRQAKELRRLLGLDQDYCVQAILAAVHSYPAVFEEFRDRSQTYRISDFQPYVISTSGASWKNDADGLPLFLPACVSLPVPAYLRVEYVSETRARITYGERVEDVNARQIYNTFDLILEWPTDLGVSGMLALDAAWGVGSRVTVNGPPKSFPWTAAGNLIRTEAAQTVLQDANLLGTAGPLNSPVECLAVIALALAKQHPDFNE